MSAKRNINFYDAEITVTEFEKLLYEYGIKIRRGSDLESTFLSVFDVLIHYENKDKYNPLDDDRALFRDFSALYDLSTKILSVKDHKNFEQLVPHLKKLNTCSIAQNKKSLITDQEANKIIELYLASLCMNVCKDIFLDHPESSKGDNPDVIAEIDGEQWGFACKTIHTHNSQTIYENIVKAIDQIEKSKSTIGIPVINLKNIIDHDKVWPINTTFNNLEIPLELLRREVASIHTSLVTDIGIHTLDKEFIGKKSLAGILFIAHSASSLYRINNGLVSPTGTRLNSMTLFTINDEDFTDNRTSVINDLNYYMQSVN